LLHINFIVQNDKGERGLRTHGVHVGGQCGSAFGLARALGVGRTDMQAAAVASAQTAEREATDNDVFGLIAR